MQNIPAAIGRSGALGGVVVEEDYRKGKRNYHSLHRPSQLQLQPFSCIPPPLSQVQVQATRQLAIRSKNRNNRSNKKKGGVDPNAPLLNEHLIAELFNKKKQDDANVTAETYEVRLIVDQGYQKKRNADDDDDEDSDDDESEDEDDNNNTSTSPAPSAMPTTQITTLASAITIAHSLSLDLMEVTLQISPPVIKAVDFDKWLYEQKKKAQAAASKKKKEGGGAISDRPLKEFKFRAGIADHDLERKTNNMLKYLEKGHAIRVTLTARMRSLKNDAMAITTTLERVKELVGDRAVEVRGMKANDRKSYGSLLLHPSKGSGK